MFYLEARELARKLRKEQTKSEKVFWEIVRGRKFCNLKFFRQHLIKIEYYGQERYFIADFYCEEKKIVIEIDGSIHDKTKEYDKLRDHLITTLGIKVIRIKNEELTAKEKLINTISQKLDVPLSFREGLGVSPR
ncbi:MAG: hypothetical protein A2Y24_07915 [Clostridiales bacterium GWE2_32_10]|nr:MAG: hypothetical protein A2Y24_07915 [Clostridiales bacterium GWE2_32_10]